MVGSHRREAETERQDGSWCQHFLSYTVLFSNLRPSPEAEPFHHNDGVIRLKISEILSKWMILQLQN